MTGTLGIESEIPFELTEATGKPVLVETGTSSKLLRATLESSISKLMLRQII